jgi:hypothetical protein
LWQFGTEIWLEKLPSKHLLKSSLDWCFLHMTLVKIIGLLAIYSTLYFIPIELEISTRGL